ncbi:hypothetical protein SGO26_09340 [Cupriavidus metallidurans]|uniref:hypothetical protein n=1 Tax=Cupriavidus TaxID=106589 RepID=UPI0025A91324|nr:hypothetical protein [Cupriavidus sp. TKC]GMG90250.1 hypothetical protein Cmtc_14700 [Cupriavidus sp. TKC]
MANTTLINSPLELTTILVRHHGIHRGLWSLTFSLNCQGSNFSANDGNSATYPGALITIQGIGIHEVEVADQLTVDAAAVNPAPDSKAGIRAVP